ncbi:hypothetical protein G7Z17_g2071 [Cylindrodendrum hubeiense]|uniref:Uncharacterized protein n=1 Tax=Cylindrodendrum hubeiense TaxID=595255 RepID=A0A9P5HIG4_9HYPO|nr:hypothetical protein G7Z17_g2071 [Cylindrodendrum hubeiense]
MINNSTPQITAIKSDLLGQTMASKEQHLGACALNYQQTKNRMFPLKLDLFGNKTTAADGWFVGECREKPLYAVNRNPGRKPRSDNLPDVILYAGPTEATPVLASARYVQTHHENYLVTIPPVLGSTENPVEEAVSNKGSWNKIVWRFSIETEVEGHREEFEWRKSSSSNISRLLGGTSSGYKLVRLSSIDTTKPTGEWVSRTDGGEVVAACSGGFSSFTSWWIIGFVGVGATGDLGGRWEVMTLITALVLKDQSIKRSQEAS